MFGNKNYLKKNSIVFFDSKLEYLVKIATRFFSLQNRVNFVFDIPFSMLYSILKNVFRLPRVTVSDRFYIGYSVKKTVPKSSAFCTITLHRLPLQICVG